MSISKIEDRELNELFRLESDEHLGIIEAGIISLEKNRYQPELQETIMREAHSLKGAARMLGLDAIEALAHDIEALFRDQIQAAQGFDSQAAKALLQVVDDLRTLSNLAVRGPEPTKDSDVLPASIDLDMPSDSMLEPMGSKDLKSPFEEIDTLRVKVAKLDRLMTSSSELQVLEKRIANQLYSLQDVTSLLEKQIGLQRAFEVLVSQFTAQDQKNQLLSHFAKISDLNRQLEKKLASFKDSVRTDVIYLQTVSDQIDHSVRELRMMPLAVLFDQFKRMIRDIASDLGKHVELVIDGADEMVDKRVLDELKDPLMHLIRNALQHGLDKPEKRIAQGKKPTGMLKLRGIKSTTSIMIEVEDDGGGLDVDLIKKKAISQGFLSQQELALMNDEQIQNIIFRPGFSTMDHVTSISGRGIGMDVVASKVIGLKGEIMVHSQFGVGTSFRLIVPQRFATTDVTVFTVKSQVFAIPLDMIQVIRFVPAGDVVEVDGLATIMVDDTRVSLVLAEEILGLVTSQRSLHDTRRHQTIIINVDGAQLALIVDEIIDDQAIVVRPPGAFIKHLKNVAGVGLLNNGDIVTVLAARDLIKSANVSLWRDFTHPADVEPSDSLAILLVEDSMITRTQEKRILEAAGYQVIVAVDGVDGWLKLSANKVDAVVSDIMMPNLDGFGLTQRIRSDNRYSDLPIVLVSTLATDEDRRRGLELGANAYITKGGFNQKLLLETLARLLGVN